MKIKILFAACLFTFVNFVYAQKVRSIPPPPLPGKSNVNKDYRPIGLSKRLKKFPFNKSAKIELVSFNLNFAAEEELTVWAVGEPKPIKKDSAIVFSREVYKNELAKLDQRKTLNLSQLNELTGILYNNCSKFYVSSASVAGCYFPRNAIIFYDENNIILEYFEICFECNRIETKPINLTEFEDFCNTAKTDLKLFFEKCGIETTQRK